MNANSTARALVLMAGLTMGLANLSGCSYQTSFDSITCESDSDCGQGATCSNGYCLAGSTPPNNTNNQTNNVNNTNNQIVVDSVEITPPAATVFVGGSETFTAEAFDAESNSLEVEVTWSNSDASVAQFDSMTGLLMGISEGTTTLTATAQGVTASAEVTVVPEISDLTIDPATVNLGHGVTLELSALAENADDTTVEVDASWSSSDESIVTVDQNGEAFGLRLGSATVTAEYLGFTAESEITVVEAPPVSLEIMEDTATVRSDGGGLEFRAIIRDANGDEIRPVIFPDQNGDPDGTGPADSLVWSSNPNKGILRIPGRFADFVEFTADPNTGAGNTDITARLGDLSDFVSVDVVDPEIGSATISPMNSTIGVDERVPISVTATDNAGGPVGALRLEWSTSESSVAVVEEDSSGDELVGLGVGAATITATVFGFETTTDVDVVFQASAIAAGAQHSCALTPAGTAWCWGEAQDGQLGNGSMTDQALPSRVDTTLTFEEIHAADSFTCALAGSDLYCWGASTNGRLGIEPVPSDTGVPQLVNQTLQFAQVSMTDDHVCALDDQDDIYCWGEGADGRLGTGNEDDQGVPTKIEDPAGQPGQKWKSVAAGVSHTCAIAMNDTVWCWGANSSGELGDGSTMESFVPVAVSTGGIGNPQFIAVAAGGGFSCALSSTNEAYCWGSNASGKLGISSGDTTRTTPAAVAGGHNFVSISTNFDHACGVTMTNGEVYCWGAADFGRLGYGMQDDQDEPVEIDSPLAFTSVSTGTDHTCGIAMNLEAYCWGRDDRDQLGAGNPGDSDSPTQVWP